MAAELRAKVQTGGFYSLFILLHLELWLQKIKEALQEIAEDGLQDTKQ